MFQVEKHIGYNIASIILFVIRDVSEITPVLLLLNREGRDGPIIICWLSITGKTREVNFQV